MFTTRILVYSTFCSMVIGAIPCADLYYRRSWVRDCAKSTMFVWMFTLLTLLQFALNADRRNAGSAQFTASSYSLTLLIDIHDCVIRSALMNTFTHNKHAILIFDSYMRWYVVLILMSGILLVCRTPGCIPCKPHAEDTPMPFKLCAKRGCGLAWVLALVVA